MAARIACAVLVIFGLVALYAASRLAFGTARAPETGFFPTLVAASLVIFSAVALAERPEHFEPAEGAARTWIVIAAVALYAALIQRVGFIACTAALLLLLLRGIGRRSWAASFAVSLLATVVCYEVFTRLGLPLPVGILPL